MFDQPLFPTTILITFLVSYAIPFVLSFLVADTGVALPF